METELSELARRTIAGLTEEARQSIVDGAPNVEVEHVVNEAWRFSPRAVVEELVDRALIAEIKENARPGSAPMKSKPKGPKRAARVKAQVRRPRGKDPSDERALTAIIEILVLRTLERMGFSKREVKDLLAGSTNALTAAVEEKFRERRGREVKK